MLLTRNIHKYFQKLQGKKDSQDGWDMKKGYFHSQRRPGKHLSKMYARKSFGRHPNANFLKG